YARSGDRSTDEVSISSLGLSEGSVMEYLFDFGDCWEFRIQLVRIEDSDIPANRDGTPAGEILESRGKAPEQYPDMDEEW
ncbi:MAG: hypothetical protein AAFY15_12640, partial [Cyanobacteria bacterium J06648_11]